MLTRDKVSDRDYQVLCENARPFILQLLPVIELAETVGADWRARFHSEASRWEIVANGRPANSEAEAEAISWSLAHKLLAEDDSLRN